MKSGDAIPRVPQVAERGLRPMATNDKRREAPAKAQKEKPRGGGEAAQGAWTRHARRARWRRAAGAAAAPARLLSRRPFAPKLTQQFGLANPHQVPTLEKIVLNVRRRRSDQAAQGARRGRRRAGDHHRPAAGAEEGEEVDRQLRAAPGTGDRRGGDAARRADVGVPRPVHHASRSRASATSAAWARGRSTDAATIRSASRSR